MNSIVHLPLNTLPEQMARLEALQKAVAEVCNALTPVVQQTRCWNRVGLHHLAYRDLRERFPHVGSQMICNAIYSVSRTCRVLFQAPGSPFNIGRYQDKALPLLHFQPTTPVYFDRHTLSIKVGQLSMYTLDGRMKFQLDLTEEDVLRFQQQKLREIVLARVGKGYRLSFSFSDTPGSQDESAEVTQYTPGDLPEYVLIAPESFLVSPLTDPVPPTQQSLSR
ncbi:MAG: hypothetical protein RBS05_12945 [Zoogloea oleivorans]|jgi:hypothetical protein|uniref:hypothetical protein n=1 Tax=Zoogloea oleivorans TaxID=1552750 RepID=UPI002A36C982|nr:hypothetical protein [Zoogloea oleivorans]MDY0036809.1 hypothetical protein [Zoogloea oleivorans]